MADEVVKGLSEIGAVLRCSAEEVRYFIREKGLPVTRKGPTGICRSTRNLLLGWMEDQAKGGHSGKEEEEKA